MILFLFFLLKIAFLKGAQGANKTQDPQTSFVTNEMGVYEIGDDTVDLFLQENMFVLIRFCVPGIKPLKKTMRNVSKIG